MVEARTIKSQLAEERPEHDLMLSTIYSPPVKAMEHEPLLPRLQLLEAVIESVSIPSFDVF
jgi:hypothetical protein